MEATGSGSGEPTSQLEASGATEDQLFLVEGVLW